MADSDWIEGPRADELIGLLLERVSAAIALFDRQMRYIACNRRWITDYKLDRDDLIGRSHSEIFPEIGEKWKILHARALSGEKLSHDLDRFQRADGTTAWVRWSIAPWRNQSGDIEGVLMVFEVLTPQMEKELRARILSEELSLFVDIAENFALCMLDNEGRVTIWNSGTQRLCGWHEAEAIGRNFEFMFSPDDRQRGLPAKQLEMARRDGVHRERCWLLRKDRTRFRADITVSRVDGDEELPPGFGHIIRDVTAEESQARSLEASTVLLQSILEIVPDAMIVIDEKGIVLSFSRTAEELFGYDADEVVGQNVSLLMPSPDRERHDEYIARYLETGIPHIIDNRRRVMGRRKDGSLFPHELRVGEAMGGGRRVFAGFVHDLTQKEDAQSRMQELQRELTHIARVSEMGTLATSIAHELNQPLMAITNLVQASAQIMAEADPQAMATVRNALDDAAREALRAGQIVRRLRRFLSRGDLEKTLENPAALAGDACELASADTAERNIACAIEVPESLPDILVDRIQIQQVIVNLIRNAIEAVDSSGKVEIAAELEGDELLFSVTDDGPGIAEEKRGRLFEPFSSTKPDGMGLGLAICRTIIEAHGGRLWYEDGAKGGAVFRFTIPLKDGETDHD